MIASLSGTLLHKSVDRVVIEIGGVGYLVHVSLQTLAELPGQGHSVTLLCHTHVREDALQLFGFLTPMEQRAFESLKGVSGVGPKLAMTILSGMPIAQLVAAIAGGDHRRLRNIPGVGKKTAERLIVDLKDRFADLSPASSAGPVADAEEMDKLVDALTGLGYKRPIAEKAVRRVAETAERACPPEKLLRRALAVIQEP